MTENDKKLWDEAIDGINENHTGEAAKKLEEIVSAEEREVEFITVESKRKAGFSVAMSAVAAIILVVATAFTTLALTSEKNALDTSNYSESEVSESDASSDSKAENSLISGPDPSYLISLPERAAFDFIDGREFTFLPIISEEEMDYMGIPYKDLTPEQVIQMWAQCTRERNWQKMYHIEKYENYSYQDSYRFEQSISDMFGRLLQCYYDVEVSEKASRENGEVLYYSIEARVVYYDSEKENDILVEDPMLSQCVVMKKIDGYWRIIDMGTGVVIPDEATQGYDFSQYELIKENGTLNVSVTEMTEDGFKGQSYWADDKDIEYTILCNKENKKVLNVGDYINLRYKKIYKTGEKTAIIVLDQDTFRVILPPDSQ